MDCTQSTFDAMVDQSVAIFSSREDVALLTRTVTASQRAIRCPRAVIDVVVNGNRSLADGLPGPFALNSPGEGGEAPGGEAPGEEAPARQLRVWYVSMGDKAHAWNEYTQRLWPRSRLAFFVDGTAMPHATAFDAIARGIEQQPEAWVATAVPTHGMSARSQRKGLLREGGIQGNLYAIRGGVLEQLIALGFQLPRGIYRTDPLLAAALCFSMDPAQYAWNARRIHVEPGASWDYDALRWWRLNDLRTHFKRVSRQKQGVLEIAAIKQWMAIDKQSPAELPETAAAMVLDWMERHPRDAETLLKTNRGCREALDTLRAPRDWSAASIAPILIGTRAF